jgi:hypothetical protein
MTQAAMLGEARIVRVRTSHDPLNHNQLLQSNGMDASHLRFGA